jgi:ribonuclease HII
VPRALFGDERGGLGQGVLEQDAHAGCTGAHVALLEIGPVDQAPGPLAPFAVVGDVDFVPVVGADRRSLAVAAASIVAKVTRDRLMRRLHAKYPVYNFLENKGYGTREHLDAIIRHGLIPEHRKSYRLKTVEKTARLF